MRPGVPIAAAPRDAGVAATKRPAPQAPRAGSAGRALIVPVVLNVFAAVLFIRSGAADALWQWLTPNVPWRTGPPWSAALAYSFVLFALHASINAVAAWRVQIQDLLPHGIRFLAGCCFLIAAQVLMPIGWPFALGAVLLMLMAGERLLDRAPKPLAGMLAIWMWTTLGLVCSRWIIPQWTLGSPQHLPRIGLLMTLWLLPIRMRCPDQVTRQMLMWVVNFASAPAAVTAGAGASAPSPASRT
jgi:hypothetical protein